MVISVVGFDALTASTDDPIGMMSACHERVRKQCATLRALMKHLDTKGADDAAAAAAHRVLRYFDEAAQHHHADEEEDLFPQLLAVSTDGNHTTLVALCSRLTHEHRSLAIVWAHLRCDLILVRSHQLPSLAAMQAVLEVFTQGYEAHTSYEDTHLLPLATSLLEQNAIQKLGMKMKVRRQIN